MTERSRVLDEAKNTDREIWREREGDYYADSIFVTEGGGIGINCGGFVIVAPVRDWHKSLRLTGPSASAPRTEQDATAAQWRNVALRIGEELASDGPNGYYDFSPVEWLRWAQERMVAIRSRELPIAAASTPAQAEPTKGKTIAQFRDGLLADGFTQDELAQVADAMLERAAPVAPPAPRWTADEVVRVAELVNVGWLTANFGAVGMDLERLEQMLRAYADLLAHAAPVSAWQPMETAPKDGAEVVLWDGEDAAVGSFILHVGWRAKVMCFEEPICWIPLPASPGAEKEK